MRYHPGEEEYMSPDVFHGGSWKSSRLSAGKGRGCLVD